MGSFRKTTLVQPLAVWPSQSWEPIGGEPESRYQAKRTWPGYSTGEAGSVSAPSTGPTLSGQGSIICPQTGKTYILQSEQFSTGA